MELKFCVWIGNRNSIRETQPINRNNNNQPNIIRNIFTSSSSSSSIRNVRRTFSTEPINHLNALHERTPDLRDFSRNTFKELENIENNRHNLPASHAFDNFDTLNHNPSNHNPGNHDLGDRNLNNNNVNNHNELIETSNRVVRPHRQSVRAVNAINRNNNFINNRKPLNPIRPIIPPRINDQPNVNDLPDNTRPSVNVRSREEPISSVAINNSKYSNATVTIESKCLDCICYGSTKCNLNMKCSGNFCGPFLISHAYW